MDYITTLQKDKVLKPLLKTYQIPILEIRQNIYLQLIRSIISQQLSTHVANIIYQRFLSLLNKPIPTLKDIHNLSIQELKTIGLSQQKANYILNIVHFFQEHHLTDNHIYNMSEDQILQLFTQIKGVGKWTVEMILIFALSKPNVFSTDDLGIKTAMITLYNIKETEPKKIKTAMTQIAQQWHPHKTFACLYLWQWVNQQIKKK